MNSHKKYLSFWFVVLSVASIFSSLVVLYATHGEAFNRLFFHDSRDTGMDFLHSIEYVRGRRPYELFNTLYPPLANLFFYVLFRFVPQWQSDTWAPTFHEGVQARGTSIDLRVWQPTMMLFMMFLIITSVLIVFLARKYTSRKFGVNPNLFSACVLLSYGVLYSFERGNIIVLAFLCCLFFEKYQHSNNRWFSILALILLAFSAGLKIYPAIMGLMLIYDKQYKRAFITILLGILALVLPALIFHEGLGGIGMFLNKLTSHTETASFSTSGFSFDRICNALIQLTHIVRGEEIGENALALSAALAKWNLPMTAIILLCGFFMNKRWEKILVCCVAMLLYSFQYPYAAIFFLIPLLSMIHEERELTRSNAFMFFALVFSVLWLPIMDVKEWPLSLIYARFQLCMVIYMLYIIVKALTRSILFCQRIATNLGRHSK